MLGEGFSVLSHAGSKKNKRHFAFTADYLKVIEQMKQVIKMAGKKVLLMFRNIV